MKALVILCFLLLHAGETEGSLVQQGDQGPCPPGVQLVDCLVDPCSKATCPSHPEAVCRSNYCGGCNAEFFIKVECSDATS